MEELDFYPHTCTVKRFVSVRSSDGVPIYTTVHTGECCLQYPNTGAGKLAGSVRYVSDPTLELPITDTMFAVNDLVEVTVVGGRVLNGTVENFEVYDDEDLEGTVIWLKNLV